MGNRVRIKKILREADIRQWQLADELQIREESLSRLFRYEIKTDKAGEIMLAIERIKSRKGGIE